jgi:hypothetical protein
MKLVVIESPFAGKVQENILYARACVKDSLLRGESPIASHLLHTQPGILDDQSPKEREHGIEAGLAWTAVCDLVAVYTDRGLSTGMKQGIERALALGKQVEFRSIY